MGVETNCPKQMSLKWVWWCTFVGSQAQKFIILLKLGLTNESSQAESNSRFYTVKLWFTTIFLCWLLFRIKFDYIFIQLFSCIFMGFNVRVKCESLVKICEESDFMTGSRLAREWTTDERPHDKHMLESE